MWNTLDIVFISLFIFRDIEKFLKGYGYIRNISVKVATPTSQEYFWHHHGNFTSQCQNSGTFTKSHTLAPPKCQNPGTSKASGTFSPSTFRKDTGLPSLKIVATQRMLSRWSIKELFEKSHPKSIPRYMLKNLNKKVLQKIICTSFCPQELDGRTMDGRRVRVEFTRDSRWGDRDSGSRYGRGKVGNF